MSDDTDRIDQLKQELAGLYSLLGARRKGNVDWRLRDGKWAKSPEEAWLDRRIADLDSELWALGVIER